MIALGVMALAAGQAAGGVVTLPITQTWQHKDTNMLCTMSGSALPHAQNHATTPAPGCLHCGDYCVPASISMYAQYLGLEGLSIQQGNVIDNRDVNYAAFDPVDDDQTSWGEVKALFR